MKRVFIILKEDIIDFPPVLSILHVLSKSSCQIYHLGTYSDIDGKKSLENMGVVFVPMPAYDGEAFPMKKVWQQVIFRNKVLSFLNNAKLNDDDIVWLIQAETIYLLSSVVKKYKTICHFFEYADTRVNWKYRLINPFLNLTATIQHAYKVVCCEYNRAQITKGVFQLKESPVILPNKMIVNESDFETIPNDISELLNNIKKKTERKKVILYQGIFLDKERRLEEFCVAMKELSEDYVFIAMGKGSDMYERLKNKYQSDKILFIPFIRPPYHLLVTRMASIGVLSYFPRSGSIGKTLNPLYCAPNKVFEYSRYGIPMISNDVPALKYAYMEYHCGKCVDYPMSESQIVATINEIMSNYREYQEGAHNFYKSVDIESIITHEIL